MSIFVGDQISNDFFWTQPPAVIEIGDNLPPQPLEEMIGMNDNDYGMIKMRLLESSTASQDRRTAGADLYAENLRYSYLIGKDRVSFAESTAQRMIGEAGSGRARQLS